MILLVFSLLEWSALGPAQETAPPAKSPQERIQSMLAENLRDVDEGVRQRYANDLILALRSASPDQSSRILPNLDQAVRYHAAQMDRLQRKFKGVDLPAGLIQEGYDLEFQYLTQRVLRAARNEWTPETRAAAARQVESLSESMEATLNERIRGEAGKEYVAREVGQLRSAWIGSLELPLNRFLDAPLPSGQLEVVKAGMKERAAPFTPVELTAADASNRQRLADLGILKLVGSVSEAAYAASQHCFAEFKGPEGRTKEWKARVDAQFGIRRKEARMEEHAKERATPLTGAHEADPLHESAAPAKIHQSPPPGDSPPPEKRNPPAPQADERSPAGSRTVVLLVILGVSALLVAWPIYRSLRSR